MRLLICLLGCALLFAGCGGIQHEPVPRDVCPEVFEIHLVLDPDSGRPGRTLSIEGGDESYLISDRVVLDGRHLAGVVPVSDSSGRFSLSIRVNEVGTNQMARFTRNHVGQRMALLIDGKLVLVITLREEIRDGRFVITGLGEEQADNMARTLLGG